MSIEVPSYLFRGTTDGWPGNDCLQEERITCTSTDPLVATLFAVECRNHGRAVIRAAHRALFSNEEFGVSQNVFDVLESAVNLRLPPIEFLQRSEFRFEVDRALEVLRILGFDQLPVRICGKSALMDAISESFSAGQRLNSEQARQFVAKACGGP